MANEKLIIGLFCKAKVLLASTFKTHNLESLCYQQRADANNSEWGKTTAVVTNRVQRRMFGKRISQLLLCNLWDTFCQSYRTKFSNCGFLCWCFGVVVAELCLDQSELTCGWVFLWGESVSRDGFAPWLAGTLWRGPNAKSSLRFSRKQPWIKRQKNDKLFHNWFFLTNNLF